MGSTPITDRSSQHLLTIFDRSERSRTSFDARGKFPRARSISDRCAIGPTSQARTHSLARMFEAAPIDPDRSPNFTRPLGKNFRGSHRRIHELGKNFRAFDRKFRVSEGPLTPLPTKSSRERFFSVRPLTLRTRNFRWGYRAMSVLLVQHVHTLASARSIPLTREFNKVEFTNRKL